MKQLFWQAGSSGLALQSAPSSQSGRSSFAALHLSRLSRHLWLLWFDVPAVVSLLSIHRKNSKNDYCIYDRRGAQHKCSLWCRNATPLET